MATKSEIERREVPPSGPSRRRRKYKWRSKNSSPSIGPSYIITKYLRSHGFTQSQ